MIHWIKASYRLDELHIATQLALLSPFSASIDAHRIEIAFRENKTADAIAQADLSVDLATQLQANEWDFDKWPRRVREEGAWFAKLPRRGFSKLNDVLKYLLRNSVLHEIAGATLPHHWSVDGINWKPFPYTFVMGPSRSMRGLKIDATLHDQIQEILDSDKMCFAEAFQHLHRAMCDYPRHAWINATIAAELAIKEFLSRYKPELKTLLIEVPSPPLHKLYGTVLKSLAGQESPKVKELAKGAEIRNKLIHRPGDTVEQVKVQRYVYDVEIAVFHLLTLLYPDDELIKWQYANISTAVWAEPSPHPHRKRPHA